MIPFGATSCTASCVGGTKNNPVNCFILFGVGQRNVNILSTSIDSISSGGGRAGEAGLDEDGNDAADGFTIERDGFPVGDTCPFVRGTEDKQQ